MFKVRAAGGYTVERCIGGGIALVCYRRGGLYCEAPMALWGCRVTVSLTVSIIDKGKAIQTPSGRHNVVKWYGVYADNGGV